VDLDRGTLTVRRTLVSTHDQTPRFGEPKSRTSRRTIALPAEAVAVLRTHKARQAKERLAATSVRFHDLRHAHATLMLRAGVPLKVASGRLGHSGITVTGDLYQHIASDMDVDAAERAARVLRQ
jgi:integrase